MGWVEAPPEEEFSEEDIDVQDGDLSSEAEPHEDALEHAEAEGEARDA
jgi:hypothetical protein